MFAVAAVGDACPPFNPQATRYDQNTYAGRLSHVSADDPALRPHARTAWRPCLLIITCTLPPAAACPCPPHQHSHGANEPSVPDVP